MPIGLTIIIHNWQMLSNKFYTNKTDFWCSRPSEFANFSVENWRKLSTPWKKIGSSESDFDNCQIFNVNFSTITTRPEENTEMPDIFAPNNWVTLPAPAQLTAVSVMSGDVLLQR